MPIFSQISGDLENNACTLLEQRSSRNPFFFSRCHPMRNDQAVPPTLVPEHATAVALRWRLPGWSCGILGCGGGGDCSAVSCRGEFRSSLAAQRFQLTRMARTAAARSSPRCLAGVRCGSSRHGGICSGAPLDGRSQR